MTRRARPAHATRLSDVAGFELYRLDDPDGAPLFQVALRSAAPPAPLEYAVWRDGDADPDWTGTVEAQPPPWDDAARIEALRRVAREHEKVMRVDPEKLAFAPPDEDEDEDDDDEGDEDEA